MGYSVHSIFPRRTKSVDGGHIFASDIVEAKSEAYETEILSSDTGTRARKLARQTHTVAGILDQKLRSLSVSSYTTVFGVVLASVSLFFAPAKPVSQGQQQSTATNAAIRSVKVAQFGDLLLYLPLYIAKEEGIFRRHGLDVSIISTGGDDKTFAAVLSGDAHFGVADPTFVAVAAQRGQAGKVCGLLVNGVPNYAVSTKPGLEKWTNLSTLQGKTIASVPAPSTSYALVKQLFESANIPPKIKQVSPQGLLASVSAGDADAALLIEPWVSTSLRKGGSLVLSLPDFHGEFALTGITTTKGTLDKSPDLARNFLAALEEAVIIFYSDDVATLRTARAVFPNEDPRDLLDGIRRHRQGKIHPFDLRVAEASWTAAIKLRQSLGDLQSSAGSFRECVDNSIADKLSGR